jgi:hypothetical protein
MHHNRRGFVRLSGAAASLAALGLWAGPAQGGQPLEAWRPIVKTIGFTADS